MHWSDISFTPSTKTLRQFAGLWLLFFAGLAGWQYFRHDNRGLALALAILAVAAGLPGLVWPPAVRLLYVGSMILTFPIGWTVSRVVLAMLFYCLFAPVGLLFRVAGRDVLGLRRPEGQESYWRPKPAAENVRRYFRQF
jgi:hypothetical protein